MSSEDEDVEHRPETVFKVAPYPAHLVLPSLSKDKYNKVYDTFQKWNTLNGTTPVSENVLMKYFTEMAVKNKASTLWVHHSMLKATLRLNDDLDISSYSTLIDFLKRKNAEHTPSKSSTFTEEEIEKFVNEAPDNNWLDVKVICIFGVNGLDSAKKLIRVKIEHVKRYDDLILVTTPKTGTTAMRSFTLTGTFFDIVQKYIALRPDHTKENRFFLQYRDGKCTIQPIGRNKLFEVPRRIAKYLKLPEPENYTSHSYRITSANIGITTNAWNSNVVEEQHIQYSLDHQTGHLKSSSVINYSSPSVSVPVSNNTEKSNTNGNLSGHVCTISCAQVQCAKEENEPSVFHAFNIVKPSSFVIAEITPSQFASDPTCRWIVTYTHITEPVSSFNANETFDEITRSKPLNVRIVQKYIRRKSSQLSAAYVVVYGVNCRCQQQTLGIFNFSVNEMTC